MWLEWRGARTSWTSLHLESQEKEWSKKAEERFEMEEEELRSLRSE